jgi:hypothetical protein
VPGDRKATGTGVRLPHSAWPAAAQNGLRGTARRVSMHGGMKLQPGVTY